MTKIGQFIINNRAPGTIEPYEDYEDCTLLTEGICKGCNYKRCAVK